MCGIAGILNFDGAPVDRLAVKRMTDTLAHRGPDGEGVWLEHGVGLGHRRLAVIDTTEASSQPMVSDDDRFVMTYNGETYNYRDLRVDLEKRGHRLRSGGDVEVVLRAYQQWGERCLDLLNGMFAFAVWDRRERTLFLARDRYGTKPLYVYRDGRRMVFGSEIKAILSVNGVVDEIDTEAMAEYLGFQNFFSDRTLNRDIRMLPAASCLTVSPRGSVDRQPRRYWDFGFRQADAMRTRAAYAEEFRQLLDQAVVRQLRSDVTVGAYLSGGLDSGAINASASRQGPGLAAFTCGFEVSPGVEDDLPFDERESARLVACALGIDLRETVVGPSDLEALLPGLVYHLEEPRVGQSYPNFAVAGLAAEHVTVVLSGVGGDELLGGYPWRYRLFDPKASDRDNGNRFYDYWRRLIPRDRFDSLCAPILSQQSEPALRQLFDSQVGRPDDASSFLDRIFGFEARTFLHGLLAVEDKLGMAHSIETRFPFLDNDLVDFLLQLPLDLKLGPGLEPIGQSAGTGYSTHRSDLARGGKAILRQAMIGRLPDAVVEQPKRGFSAPDAGWFRSACRPLIERFGKPGLEPVSDYLDTSVLSMLIKEHLAGTKNYRLLLWSVLYLNQWLCQRSGGVTPHRELATT